MNKYQKGFAPVMVIGLVIIILLIIGGVIYFLLNNNFQQQNQGQGKEIESSAIWNGLTACGENWPEKWTDCDIDCFYDNMKLCEASTDAIVFSRLFSEKAYLEKFEEMGKVDLGWVTFPTRANTNQEVYLLNGSPSLVSTVISEEPISDEMNDPLYSEMKNKYNDANLWKYNPKFIKKELLQNNSERYIFQYRFNNGCHACGTEYLANIAFDFDADGKFLKTTFLQIIKGELDTSYAQQYQKNNEENKDWNIYKNEEYGFEFKYPKNYLLGYESKKFIEFKRNDNPQSCDIDIAIVSETEFLNEKTLKLESTSNLSFIDFITNELKKNGSDSPMGSTYFRNNIEIEPFKNNQGIQGYSILMTRVQERYKTSEAMGTIKEEVMPFYAFDISQQTNNKARGIIFRISLDGNINTNSEILKQIANTFKFL
ncbi:MAG: hypothetical protein WA091_01980 [Minisyncoccales bacterium]